MARRILENVPTRPCACGCGEQIPTINPRYHYPIKYKHGHCPTGHFTTERMKGVRNNYKGGRVVSQGGYIWVRCEGHPRAKTEGHYIQEHILVMEKYLGRYLIDGEQVHHINKNKQDNRIENLRLMTISEHSKFHRLEEYSQGLRKKFIA